jgi:hypothetical protein
MGFFQNLNMIIWDGVLLKIILYGIYAKFVVQATMHGQV